MFSKTTILGSGSTCSNAIVVSDSGTYGANMSSGNQWFKFKNTKSATKLVEITSCNLTTLDTYLKIYKTCNTSSILESDEACGSQSKLILNLEPNDSILIEWAADFIHSGFMFNWTLKLSPTVPYLFCSDALSVSEGEFSTNNGVGNQWYLLKNTYPDSTYYEISSVGKTEADTYLKLYKSCGDTAFMIEDDYFDDNIQNLQSKALVKIEPNDSVYIKWDGTFNKETFNWEIKKVEITAINDQVINTDFKIYPTETTAIIHFSNKVDQLKIISLEGTSKFETQNVSEIDISDLSNGIYILQCEVNGNLLSKKVIKQ